MKHRITPIAASFLALLPVAAQAQIFSSAENVGDAIADFLTGGFGITVGIIGCAVFGILAMSGRISWNYAIAIIVGLIALFGGAQIVSEVRGLAG
ncbi:MAG: hypothetical protein DI582_11130 [Azospirillum brasilense]|nr:MAG: hypothetical protein DI582_11130 [Azospirillum brasilense]